MSLHPTRAPLALLIAGALPLAGCGSIGRAPGVVAGFVSHQLCSGVFVGGQDPETYYREAVGPNMSVLGPLIRHTVDRQRGEVTASIAGVITRRAAYRGPLGCVAVHGAARPAARLDLAPPAPPVLADIAGPAVVEPADPALKAALNRAFAESEHGPRRYTKAVVIPHDGQVIAERYAPGFGVDTPIQGWSMTKSVTNALLAILVRDGKLSMDGPAPIAAWSNPTDPRHRISVDQLLRMTSGLDIGQSLTSDPSIVLDPTAYMVFDTDDMAGIAEQARLGATPGSHWRYTNGNTLLLSRIIRDHAGGDAASVEAFARRELFDKLGMRGVTLEVDGVGTPIGASHMWAPARDWARFGQLYLDDGVVGGQRILPAGWVDYSARLTRGSEDFGYGAGFWTNRGASRATAWRVGHGMPADSFMARGSWGQSIVIVPSARLVIVRLGYAYTDRNDIAALERLVADAVVTVKDRPAAN